MISRRTILGSATLGALLAACSDQAAPAGLQAPPTSGSPTATGPPASSTPAASQAQPPPSVRPSPPSGPAIEVGHGPRSRHSVALTFHGAGTTTIARAVLGELRRAGAPATVMAVGSWLDGDPATARLVLDDGHELGNHTAHHLPMRTLSAAVAEREITSCARTLTRLTGSPGRWFRASGTQHTTTTIRTAAAAAGYATCLSYDVDSLDWQDPPPAQITAAVMRSVHPGSIVSLHLGHAGTVAAVPALLEALATAGLRPVTVTDLLR